MEPLQSDKSDSDPSETEGSSLEDAQGRSFYEQPLWKRMYAFLLAPFLLAAAAVGIFTVFSLMTQENTNPEELISILKSGGEHRRSQAAFALTKFLQPSVRQNEDRLEREADEDYKRKLDAVRLFVPDLIDIFKDPNRGDVEVQKFLSLAFGYLGDRRAVAALSQVLENENEELVTYALVSLTQIKDTKAVPAIIAASQRTEPSIRSTAIYALGVLGTEEAIQRLEQSLTDQNLSVRWNSAFALARHQNNAGEPIILEILERGPIYQAIEDEPQKQKEQFLNAVRSAGMLRTTKVMERIRKIAHADENLQAMDLAKKLIEANSL